MRMLSIEQKGYLPYTHTGTHFLHVDFMDRVTAIMASNGFGKSSLLRELNPYPSSRTDYQKNGYVKKSFKHGSHVYDLTSDYRNITKPHSFKEDGEELNISGTTETQRDLIEEKFGLTQVIEDLMSGKFNVCDMRMSERKALFSCMYPSDLTFVLDYHKQVCSQIRIYSNQIKLLKTRDTSLRGKLMSEDQLKELAKTKSEYDYLINLIDKLNLLLEGENERLRQMREYDMSYDIKVSGDLKQWLLNDSPQQDTSIVDVLDDLRERYNLFILKHPKLASTSFDFMKRITVLEQSVIKIGETEIGIKETTSDKVSQIEQLRDELDGYINCKNANKVDEKDSLEKSVQYFKEQIARFPDQYNLSHIIQKDRLDAITMNTLPRLFKLTSDLHSFTGQLLSRADVAKLNQDIETNCLLQSGKKSEMSKNDERIEYFKNRLTQLKTKGYPSDCMRGCGIRESLSKMINDTVLQLKLHEDNKEFLEVELGVLVSEELVLKNKLQAPSLALPIIEEIWKELSRENLGEFILNGGNLISYLNDNCTELPNSVSRLVTESGNYWACQEYTNALKLAEGKLETLKNAEKSMLSIEVINRAIADRELKLETLHQSLNQDVEKLKKLSIDRSSALELIDMIREIDELTNGCIAMINSDKLHKRVQFNEMIIQEHVAIRNEINARLREIETTLTEQNNYHTIVTQEIEPTLKDLEQKQMKWEYVEFGLSPTKGLPYIYLVRFINKLIKHVNEYIRAVWCYDMELIYLKEDETLDFGIEVLINKSSIVKDINICSDGQKSIINLAMTLAICKERGFGKLYPLKLDEVDSALTDEHRTNLVSLLSGLVERGDISQMFLVNHFVLHSGMTHCETICLSTDGIVVPNVFNEHVQLA